MTIEEALEELYLELARLRALQTPYLMLPQEESDLRHLLKTALDGLQEEQPGSAW